MSDQTFEMRLQSAFDAFADEMPVDVDPITLAAVIRSDSSRPKSRVAMPQLTRPRWLIYLMAALLLATALVGAAVVASRLLGRHEYLGVVTPATDSAARRVRPVVVAFDDGRVLVAGGQLGSAEPIGAEVFDPRTGLYAPFVGDIPIGTGSGLLLADGRVFAVIFDSTVAYELAAFVFDPESMTTRRVLHQLGGISPIGYEPSMALLRDGHVLIVSDDWNMPVPSPAFIFDPVAETLTQTGTPGRPRTFEAVTTLEDGRVLVAGGRAAGTPASAFYGVDGLNDDAEIYDPSTGQFTSAGTMPSVRGDAQSFLMADGRVLIAQRGDTSTRFGAASGPVELDVYDPASGTFTALEPGDWPGPPTMTGLADGRLLLTGVRDASASGGTASDPWSAIYDPATDELVEHQPPRAIFPYGAETPAGVVLVGGFTDPPLTQGDPSVPWTDVFE